MNKNMLLGLASIMGAAFGVVVGAIMRQPEINKLKKQVKILQSNISELEDVIERQNFEISRLYANYKAIGIFNFLKKREARTSLEEALILQYATVEYLEMVVACANGSSKLNDADIQFYKAYGKIATVENAAPEDKATVKNYIMRKHSAAIHTLNQANPDKVLEEIKAYGKPSDKRRTRMPFGIQKS